MEQPQLERAPLAFAKRHRLRLQSIALALIVIGSFALFLALRVGQDRLAAAIFGVIALSFALTVWIG